MIRHRSWSKIVPPHMSAPVSFASGRNVSSENGCVGAVRSPGAAPCGTGRSGAGTISSPFLRSSTNRLPTLVGWMIAGMTHLGAVFVRLDDRATVALGRSHVDQAGLRGNVHVPEVVIHGLVRPGALAG